MLIGRDKEEFFLNFGNCPWQNNEILIGQKGKLIISDWLSALHLAGSKTAGF